MTSRTSIALLLPLLAIAILLCGGCTGNVIDQTSDALNQARSQGAAAMSAGKVIEGKIGSVVTKVQSGVTVMVDGVKQIQSGAAKLAEGKSIILQAGSGAVNQ